MTTDEAANLDADFQPIGPMTHVRLCWRFGAGPVKHGPWRPMANLEEMMELRDRLNNEWRNSEHWLDFTRQSIE